MSKIFQHERVLANQFLSEEQFCDKSPHPISHKKIIMPKPKKEGWVDWTKCPARCIVLTDLEDGILSLEESVTPATQAWHVYRDLPEFTGVCFEQFNERLEGHRAQIKAKSERVIWEEAAFARDRAMRPFPRPETHDHRGKRIFNGSAAQPLLREDVKNGVHETMTPQELHGTRPEYKMFLLDDFRPRIYQEVRYQKFCNWLEKKRHEKNEDARGPRNYKFPMNKKMRSMNGPFKGGQNDRDN